MITIRLARSLDAPALAALAGTLGYPAEEAEMQARLERILGRDDQLVIVAETGATVGGWLTAHAFDTLASGFRVQLTGLVVSDRHRRLGIGRQLVNRAEAWAREIGATTVCVFSNVQRTESHEFYPALGYTRTKTEAAYRRILSDSSA
jgi:GNAT superfamily N-acetyltransferase